jgi:hypothetical protein
MLQELAKQRGKTRIDYSSDDNGIFQKNQPLLRIIDRSKRERTRFVHLVLRTRERRHKKAPVSRVDTKASK